MPGVFLVTSMPSLLPLAISLGFAEPKLESTSIFTGYSTAKAGGVVEHIGRAFGEEAAPPPPSSGAASALRACRAETRQRRVGAGAEAEIGRQIWETD